MALSTRGSALLLTGASAAANPIIQEEALQAALVRLLQEAQPRLDKVALVRQAHGQPSFLGPCDGLHVHSASTLQQVGSIGYH